MVGGADGAAGSRVTQERGLGRVAASGAIGDAGQHLPRRLLKRSAVKRERQVERAAPTGEVLLELGDGRKQGGRNLAGRRDVRRRILGEGEEDVGQIAVLVGAQMQRPDRGIDDGAGLGAVH
jgi:hypothetical protein